MKGKLNTTKGTLLEMFIKLSDGGVITIQPLFNDASLVLFDQSANSFLKNDVSIEKSKIIVLNHSGDIVSKYDLPAEITDIENTVLYPDGRVWNGSVFAEFERNSISLIILTEEAISLLNSKEEFSFEADSNETVPTILVRFEERLQRMCGNHQCGRCFFRDKFVSNEVTGDQV